MFTTIKNIDYINSVKDIDGSDWNFRSSDVMYIMTTLEKTTRVTLRNGTFFFTKLTNPISLFGPTEPR